MPSLRLKYMIEDYREMLANITRNSPSLKLRYMVPDYDEIAKYFDRLDLVSRARDDSTKN